MLNVLVTGATGFVGTHLSLALKDHKNIKMILACRDQSKLLKDFQETELRIGDLRDENYLHTLFEGVDILINLASWASLFGQADNSEKLYLKPTLEVIKRAKKAGVKKYLNLSSLSVADSKEAVDANAQGKLRSIWPHFNNLIHIENDLRHKADASFQVINLRCGIFIGKHYALGLIPILLPRLKTHLVPLVNGGKTQMPLIDGSDIAQAFVQAVISEDNFNDYEAFNILGKEVPQMREVLQYLHEKHKYPYPHFSVPFFIAYPFARLMEIIDPIMPFEPLIVPSIVHLLEDTHTNNTKAEKRLGYKAKKSWKDALDEQLSQMSTQETKAMSMNKSIT